MNVNDSLQMTSSQGKESGSELDRKTGFVEELTMHSAHNDHKPYGNMLILLETQQILVTLGPDYLCFLATFISFSVADYYLIGLVNAAFENIFIKVVNFVFVAAQLMSYLLIAVSNPGVALESNMPSEQTMGDEDDGRRRYCLKCKIRMYKHTYHCKRCDVCIRDYDHHCPWVSKCIGGSNLKRFYFFVSITPIYIMYFIIMLLISVAITADPRNK